MSKFQAVGVKIAIKFGICFILSHPVHLKYMYRAHRCYANLC